jgi:hypothetical protein
MLLFLREIDFLGNLNEFDTVLNLPLSAILLALVPWALR